MNMKKFLYSSALLAAVSLVSSCTDASGRLTDTGVFLLIFFVLFVVLIGAFVIGLIRTNRKTKARQEKAISIAMADNSGFTATKEFKGTGTNSYYLAIDDSKERVLYVFDTLKVLCDFKDIVAVEILEDGAVTTSSKSVAGTIGGAIVGGVIAGGVGAIVGGMTGKSSSHTQVLSLKVHVLLRNHPVQSFDIECYSGDGNEEKYTYIRVYDAATKRAHDLFDTFKLIIDKAGASKSSQGQNTKSPAEEIQELSELMKQGLITEEEFKTMKSKIIHQD